MKNGRSMPGHEGRHELGERTVADPLEPGAQLRVTVNVRESAIAHMRSRNRINAAQEAAGERYRQLYELAAIGRAGGIDPGKEPVQGGMLGDPISDDLVFAVFELNRARRVLGPGRVSVLELVLLHGSIEAAAAAWSRLGGLLKGRRAEGYVSGTLVDVLDLLVAHWQLEGIGRPKLRRAWYRRAGTAVPVFDGVVAAAMTVTGPARELRIGRLGDVIVGTMRPGLDSKGPFTINAMGSVGLRAQRKR